MMDDPTGPEQPDGPTAARDGEPDADELARRRAAKGQPISDTAAAEANGGQAEEADGQQTMLDTFELVQEKGRPVTIAQLIARGTPVIQEWKFEGKSSRGTGGLIPFSSPDVLLLVDARAGKVEIDPTYDAEGSVEKVTIRPHVKAVRVYDARTEQARVRFNGLEEGAPAVAES